MSKAYHVTRKVEKWVRCAVALLFIGVGFYYLKYTFGVESLDVFYPFEIFAKWLSYGLFGLDQGSRLGGAVEFFIYDTLKIFALMIVITHIMSLMRFYLPIEKLRDFLTGHKFYGLDYFLATVFGALTPFCTCSSIPLFVGFLEARIPLGVTFAFLITSPLVNEAAVAMFIGIFGWKVTGLYVSAGIVIGMVGGFILGKMKLEKYVEDFVWKVKSDKLNEQTREHTPWKKVAALVSREAFDITKKVAVYILAGIAIGALIHGFVPQGFFERYLEGAGFWGVPLAVILAVPMYSNATGVIPVIQALVAKGVPLGTALAFMMGVVGLSLPEALILKKVLKWQLLAWFFGVVTVGIIIIGYLFNLVL
ncbi:MAG: permease [Patescibacteria group bacterium]|nr:permease [Patescibacteria group bacterium]